MQVETQQRTTKRAIGFDIKMAWLAISRMYNTEASRGGINTNMGFVLLHIDEKEGTPATKIAPLMGMEPRSLTRMLKKMEEQGLVYREADPGDKRVTRILPTDYGRRVRAVAREVVIGFNKKLYASLSEEKLRTFFEVIDTIHAITPTHQTDLDKLIEAHSK